MERMKKPPTIESCRVAFVAAGGNAKRAAKALGIAAKALRERLKVPDGRGRPRAVLDDSAVMAALRLGSQRQAARALGVGESTLRNYLRYRRDEDKSTASRK